MHRTLVGVALLVSCGRIMTSARRARNKQPSNYGVPLEGRVAIPQNVERPESFSQKAKSFPPELFLLPRISISGNAKQGVPTFGTNATASVCSRSYLVVGEVHDKPLSYAIRVWLRGLRQKLAFFEELQPEDHKEFEESEGGNVSKFQDLAGSFRLERFSAFLLSDAHDLIRDQRRESRSESRIRNDRMNFLRRLRFSRDAFRILEDVDRTIIEQERKDLANARSDTPLPGRGSHLGQLIVEFLNLRQPKHTATSADIGERFDETFSHTPEEEWTALARATQRILSQKLVRKLGSTEETDQPRQAAQEELAGFISQDFGGKILDDEIIAARTGQAVAEASELENTKFLMRVRNLGWLRRLLKELRNVDAAIPVALVMGNAHVNHFVDLLVGELRRKCGGICRFCGSVTKARLFTLPQEVIGEDRPGMLQAMLQQLEVPTGVLGFPWNSLPELHEMLQEPFRFAGDKRYMYRFANLYHVAGILRWVYDEAIRQVDHRTD